MDYLLMAAQGYQESQLDQNAKSQVGAVGVMQLMPATGKDMKVGDITQIETNIHAGVKYMRFMIDQYFKDEPMDQLNKGLFAFASYNAGPGRVRQLRREAEKRGLDPNVWFGNVEQIASERIGRETVTYVSNIYKYYVAYRLLAEERDRRDAAKARDEAGRQVGAQARSRQVGVQGERHGSRLPHGTAQWKENWSSSASNRTRFGVTSGRCPRRRTSPGRRSPAGGWWASRAGTCAPGG